MSSAAARSDEAPALAVEELVAGYGGVIALDRVSISAGTAAITAVLGANGAGKTTLLRAISGMRRTRPRQVPSPPTRDPSSRRQRVAYRHPDVASAIPD